MGKLGPKGSALNEHKPRAGIGPLSRLGAPAWSDQEPTWRDAKPALIGAALRRAQARPSGNWYVLAASREIHGGKPYGRVVAGVEVVAWRDAGGGLHVGPGSCPHLDAPLCDAAVHEGSIVCRWHGMRLPPGGRPGWLTYPAYDDGVLAWVRLDAVGGEEPLATPVLGPRPMAQGKLATVATVLGRCEPQDVLANRLDPWHGGWFHPYSFTNLSVISAPAVDSSEADDRFLVKVSFRLARDLGVAVHAAFSCPEPRTITMAIVDGEGTGSVVETHATPLGPDERGRPRTAVIEAVIIQSDRPGFDRAHLVAPALRPLIGWAAKRLWRDDIAYAERRYLVRSRSRLG